MSVTIDDELWYGTATTLSEQLPVTRQAVAKHLGVLYPRRSSAARRVDPTRTRSPFSAPTGRAGTEFMNAVEDWAPAGGVAHLITLETFADSPMSVPFYEHRMGYRRHEIIFAKRLY